MEYVVGFIFDELLENIWLIRKNKPTWQAGLLNGIGGKIEIDERPINAMQRESIEEVNYFGEWIHYGRMGGSDWSSELFYSIKTISANIPVTMEEEVVEFVSISDVITGKLKTISNLPWLITSAINHINIGSEGSFFIDVKYVN